VSILTAPSPLISDGIEGPYELTPSVVPVRTFFCRSKAEDPVWKDTPQAALLIAGRL
jgi:hypothetical protein